MLGRVLVKEGREGMTGGASEDVEARVEVVEGVGEGGRSAFIEREGVDWDVGNGVDGDEEGRAGRAEALSSGVPGALPAGDSVRGI